MLDSLNGDDESSSVVRLLGSSNTHFPLCVVESRWKACPGSEGNEGNESRHFSKVQATLRRILACVDSTELGSKGSLFLALLT